MRRVQPILAALLPVLALARTAQPPAPVSAPLTDTYTYTYTGKPVALTAVCANAEIRDFGLTCGEDDPCPVYVELSSVEPAGDRLFLSGNFHSENVTLWSLLLASDDLGRTWTEPVARRRGVLLDQIQFFDSAHGWISGQTAGTLPRDPFLLLTSDGGATWTQARILEEGSVGAIEYFRFDSATYGVLAIDRERSGGGRHVTFETKTGGDTWSMLESHATPPAAPARPAALWRIVADGRSKSLRVERRESSAWTSVAAFALSAGSCRPTRPKTEAGTAAFGEIGRLDWNK